MKILITGGCGYIGSHVALNLLSNGYEIIIIDDLRNSSLETIKSIKKISNIDSINFFQVNILDEKSLSEIFKQNDISLVMHFAGLKSVPESIKFPLSYYDNNIVGTINLLKNMKKFKIKKLIFSSSATVYSKEEMLPWNESSGVNFPNTPYGSSKLIIEKILNDLSKNDKELKIGILRYFNPIGAHKSGLIGEDFNKKSTNLIPCILNVLSGYQKEFELYGDDYNTPDGSCIRDYIHINDLAAGHVAALKFLEWNTGYHVWNLGTGKGHSTLQIIEMFNKNLSTNIPIVVKERRKGDMDMYWADVSKAKDDLDWMAYEGIDTMVKDTLNFYYKNKNS